MYIYGEVYRNFLRNHGIITSRGKPALCGADRRALESTLNKFRGYYDSKS